MHLAETELREHLSQHLEAVFEILQVALLAFFYEGEHDIHLTALSNLLADAVVERGHARVEDMRGSDGFTAWWQFVDDAHVEVAVEGHGQGAWNGCGRHHENMGRIGALAP